MTTIGFTGTREGVTNTQREALMDYLIQLNPQVAHHGDCVGADAVFDNMCAMLGIHRFAWPGLDREGRSPSRAFCQAQVIEEPRPYKTRDRIIAVKGVDGLIACPKGPEQLRSGTWMTVRIARNIGRQITIIYPDGSIKMEEER